MKPPIPSGTIFVKDPIDQWNKETTIGLAELAARNGSMMVSDKRGNLVFQDGFDSGTPRYNTTLSTGSTAYRSATYCKSGEFSVELTTGSTMGNAAGINYLTTDFREGKIGIKVDFSPDSTYTIEDSTITMSILYHDGSAYHRGKVRIDTENDELQIHESGSYTTIADISSIGNYGTDNNWTSFKLVLDLSTDKYDRISAYGTEYDISDYNLMTVASSVRRYMRAYIELITTTGAAKRCYIDNVVLTDNEPE